MRSKPSRLWGLILILLIVAIVVPNTSYSKQIIKKDDKNYIECIGDCGNGKGVLTIVSDGKVVHKVEGIFTDERVTGRMYFSKGFIPSYPDGSYDGEALLSTPHGQGIEWRGDIKYDGEWKNGLKYGKGTMTWPDGKKYIGDWVRGKRHGNGVLYKNDVLIFSGKWIQGKMVKN